MGGTVPTWPNTFTDTKHTTQTRSICKQFYKKDPHRQPDTSNTMFYKLKMLNPAASSQTLSAKPDLHSLLPAGSNNSLLLLPPSVLASPQLARKLQYPFLFLLRTTSSILQLLLLGTNIAWLKTEIAINRSLYLGIYNLHNTMSRFSVNMYPTWQNPWHYHEQAKILHLCQSRKQISS